MIVKIQTPISSNVPPEQRAALVYNKDRSKEFPISISDELIQAMKGRPKAFFNVHFEGANMIIDSEAPWQKW